MLEAVLGGLVCRACDLLRGRDDLDELGAVDPNRTCRPDEPPTIWTSLPATSRTARAALAMSS